MYYTSTVVEGFSITDSKRTQNRNLLMDGRRQQAVLWKAVLKSGKFHWFSLTAVTAIVYSPGTGHGSMLSDLASSFKSITWEPVQYVPRQMNIICSSGLFFQRIHRPFEPLWNSKPSFIEGTRAALVYWLFLLGLGSKPKKPETSKTRVSKPIKWRTGGLHMNYFALLFLFA